MCNKATLEAICLCNNLAVFFLLVGSFRRSPWPHPGCAHSQSPTKPSSSHLFPWILAERHETQRGVSSSAAPRAPQCPCLLTGADKPLGTREPWDLVWHIPQSLLRAGIIPGAEFLSNTLGHHQMQTTRAWWCSLTSLFGQISLDIERDQML